MSAGPSLYRRHRPRTFADVVGSDHVVRTLSHAIERDQIHHAYLFVGSRGTGKTSMAKILAASLNCEQGPTVTPCGSCESCVSIANATSLDVIEMDAASNNSVDDIRALRETVAYAPVSGRHKVYILDEAHMLSTQAWNAFLKTLEEPPPRTVFVLATTEANKVLPTIVDRCHRFDFGRPGADQVATVVRRVSGAEGIAIDAGAVALIARHATGSYRDALGTLEQVLTYAGGETIVPQDVLDVLGIADTEQLLTAVDAIAAGDAAAALRAAAELAAGGRDPGQVLRDLEIHARELLTAQIVGEVPPELRVTADRDARLLAQARSLGETDAVRLLELVTAAIAAGANGAHPRIQLELALIKAAAPQTDPSVAALMARIERLEQERRAAPPMQFAPQRPQAAASDAPVPEVAADDVPVPEAASHDVPAPEAASDDVSAPDAGSHDVPAPEAGSHEVPAPEADSQDVPAPDAAPDDMPAPQVVPDDVAAPEVAAAEEPAGQADLDLAQVTKFWPAVVEMVRSANGMLGGMIAPARPLSVTATELVLAFPPEAEFQRRKAEQDEHRRTAQEALRNVTGVTMTIRYELAVAAPPLPHDGSDERPVMEAEPPAPQPMSEDELVDRLVDEFGATEISDQNQESQ